jgi:hypothetical protein
MKSEEKKLNEMISKMGSYEGEIYRGMAFYDESDAIAFVNEARNSNTIQMMSISSWSSSEKVANTFTEGGSAGVKLKVKNKSGAAINHLSRHNDEYEVILPTTAKYKFSSMKTSYDGTGVPIYTITLEEV